MSSSRLIDATPAKARSKDVEVLVLGFSRTGTMSLKTALERLGYSVYHMSEALKNTKNGHLTFWNEALRAKFEGDGTPFGKKEFDKFLGEYTVLEDIPCIMFVDELLAAYPSAKVILTNRDIDSWEKSMRATFFKITNWRTMSFWAKYDTKFWGPYMSILRIIMTHWGSGDPNDRLALRHYYVNHYAHVRRVVPKEKLLEFQSSDGWGPLCQFLGSEAPNVEYPRVNDAAQTVNLHIFLQFFRVWKLVEKPLIYMGALGAAVWAVWLGYRKINLE